ncbi:hypothetical protein GALMADRAFT_1107732 [Galerina marginata CBS 339.88]|uniref:C2H2-type domain-containing protein n=1 Tax=Galerina marginata (strain CBS 339.88) TaxID=685588 RepID=A0A067TCA5_GALM3|nr:hypothetical protein GALMADRAFT_1107732 [Galerina marginata CBS 339.88]
MDTPATAPKRPRAPSGSSSSSLTTSPGPAHPPHKASRIIVASSLDTPTSNIGSGRAAKLAKSGHPLLCNLPPTCHQHPTPIANTNELERHYATYHAHVCEVDRCGCVFTDARLLELHQTECHDPIAALRKERGEKIFQCHVPAPGCGRNFLTPKARRLHLIQAHSYPKEYFFAVTNKGIGGLLKKWGEGASMIRKEWKPREQEEKQKLDINKYREGDQDVMDEEDEEDDDDDDDEEHEMDEDQSEDAEEEPGDLEATPRMLPRTTGIHSPQSSVSSSQSNQRRCQRGNSNRTDNTDDTAGVAGLTNSLNSLSLVPNSIRFGRGGKSGGFLPNARAFRGRGRGRGGGPAGIIQLNPQQMEVDPSRPGMEGLGARGRGRGRIVPPRARGRGRGRGYGTT